MSLQLTPIQRRILGVLIEKSLTTPAAYPMTMNAIVAAANQLTCRNPVMRLTEAQVGAALYELQQMLLLKQAPPGPTSRANRFEHQIEPRFGWDKRERAIMAELLLRGPQTVGELRGNASRMTPLEDIEGVGALLAGLARHDPPYVRELPRQPGKGAVRYDHTFYQPEEVLETPAAEPVISEIAQVGWPVEARLKRLEAEVAALRQQVEALEARVAAQEHPTE